MLPSTTIHQNTIPGLPSLTVGELTAIGRAHSLSHVHAAGAPISGQCSCGLTYTLCPSPREVGIMHGEHVDEEILMARRDKARGGAYTPRHRATTGGAR